ncbi:hypothetical protein [Glutamicibacter sp.]|uniref:hypothetical protein n=1 Tax=Glutamicibacter sp. TaxID=1931995 RepID=UPI0028BD2C1F|nr:hypothetical protein [Glutamicibacter sp.]
MQASYLEVDLYDPLVFAGVALIVLVFGIPILLHAWIRKAKFNKLPDGYQTHALRTSIRIETIVGAAAIAMLAALGIASWVGFNTAWSNLEANIEQKYHPVELNIHEYNGSWIGADITLEDGTSFNDVVVEIRDGNEPFITEVWYHDNPEAAG